MKKKPGVYIGVIGGSVCTQAERSAAFEIGRLIASEGWVLVCGGMGGVMEAACRGACESGGITIGILPGDYHGEGNAYLGFEIVTGLDEARNSIVVRTSHAIVSIGGGFGTLSELAFAGICGIPVVGLGTWDIEPEKNSSLSVLAFKAASPKDAIERIKELLKGRF